ncbi:unnamed protein product [Meganyctiphanes norvegica]|uniref:C2H2-type domain-containing protein n=1 Tax=Meganyctiphanes norvegica TaxID=48144 RepID=A0AAV2QX65_MEGNR
MLSKYQDLGLITSRPWVDNDCEFKCTKCDNTYKDANSYRNHLYMHRDYVKHWTRKFHIDHNNIFKASNGCLHRLSNRANLKFKIMFGEKGSADYPEALEFVNTFSQSLLTDFKHLSYENISEIINFQ